MSLSLAKQYTMDKDAEQHGRWISVGDGAELKIARATNPEAQKLREKLQKPFDRPGFRPRKMSDAEEKRISVEVIAHAILKDWRGIDLTGLEQVFTDAGISDLDVKDPKYTPALGKALLDWSEDFYRDVITLSVNEDLFRAESLEADAQD